MRLVPPDLPRPAATLWNRDKWHGFIFTERKNFSGHPHKVNTFLRLDPARMRCDVALERAPAKRPITGGAEPAKYPQHRKRKGDLQID
jgi:hypothetical protein